jgi:hypothetical protein
MNRKVSNDLKWETVDIVAVVRHETNGTTELTHQVRKKERDGQIRVDLR